MKPFNETIAELIAKRHEGGYWDFKESHADNKADFLHDIICMANNTENHDGYLIYGVADGGTVVGLSSEQKKKSADINNFLGGIKFAGGTRPMVSVQDVTIDDKTIQVLVVENSSKTPFWILEDYTFPKQQGNGPQRTIKAGYIYTRVSDKNTDKDKQADIDKVEYLWRKRFGIDKSVLERLHLALDDWQNWGRYTNSLNRIEFEQGGDWGNYDSMLNRQFPEFRIEINQASHQKWEMETMRCFYMNQTSGHYVAKIFYNSTEICSFTLAHVDEYRKYLVVPRTGHFSNDERRKEKGGRYGVCSDDSVFFYYMTENSIEGKVQKIITHGTYSTACRGGDEWWLLLFADDTEYKEFVAFAEANPQYYKLGIKSDEHMTGDEERGAHIPMGDTRNAYRFYVEFMLAKGKKTREDFGRWFNYYAYLAGEDTPPTAND